MLTYLQREPGFERVGAALTAGAWISTVNLAEVRGMLAARDLDADGVVERLKALGLEVEPFLEADAAVAGSLYPGTRRLELSLGDRACVALASRLGARALTANRAWRSANLGIEIEVIR